MVSNMVLLMEYSMVLYYLGIYLVAAGLLLCLCYGPNFKPEEPFDEELESAMNKIANSGIEDQNIQNENNNINYLC